MKPLIVTSLLALAAPQASAGDLDFILDVVKGRRGHAVRVGVGYRDHDRDRRHHRRGHRPRRDHRDHRDHCYCTKHFVPGRYVEVTRRVWVPGCERRVWQPAEYGYRYDRCGRPVRVCLRPAGWVVVQEPGRWETRCERVWEPGHWEYHCNTPGHRH